MRIHRQKAALTLHHGPARMRRLLAVACGLLLMLATPPAPFGFLAWFALVPLFHAVERAESRHECFNLGFLFAFVWHAGTMYWIAWNSGTSTAVSIASALGLAWLLSLWLGLIMMLHRTLLDAFGRWAHLLAVPLWMASDVVWQSGDWSFPWITLALTQANSLQILQLASIGGSILITGWVVSLNALLTLGARRWSVGVIVIALICGVWIWGAWRESKVDRKTAGSSILSAAIIQGNIDPGFKYNLGVEYSLNIYDALCYANIPDSTDLMIWPENAAPVYVEQDYRWRRHLQKLVDDLDAALITGGEYADFHSDRTRTPYNAAFLIRPDGHQEFEIYKKVFLVPFGERIPFQWVLPFLGKLDFGQAEFKPGDAIVSWPVPVRSDTVFATPLICYEAIFPEAGWKSAQLGAQFMVNMTNDGWFTGTGQQVQHLLLSRTRSIETGRSLVRTTNTGISAFIAPSGRIEQSLGPDIRGVLLGDVRPPVDTYYIRWGWHDNLLSLLAAGVLLLVSWIVLGLRYLRSR